MSPLASKGALLPSGPLQDSVRWGCVQRGRELEVRQLGSGPCGRPGEALLFWCGRRLRVHLRSQPGPPPSMPFMIAGSLSSSASGGRGRVCSLARTAVHKMWFPGRCPLRAWRALVPVSGAGVLAAAVMGTSGPHCSLTERPVLPSPKLFMTSRRP